MTNDLFRDLLDGRIHVRRPFKIGGIVAASVDLTFAQAWFLDFITENRSFPQPRIIMGADPATWDEWDKPIPVLTSYHAYYQTTTPTTPELRALIYGAPRRPRDGYSITKPIYDETNPRARALRAKNQRGTGPAPEPLRVRGRINRYQEKS